MQIFTFSKPMFLENKQLPLGSPTGPSLSVSGLPYPTTSFSNTFACFLGLSNTNSHSAIILAVVLSFNCGALFYAVKPPLYCTYDSS